MTRLLRLFLLADATVEDRPRVDAAGADDPDLPTLSVWFLWQSASGVRLNCCLACASSPTSSCLARSGLADGGTLQPGVRSPDGVGCGGTLSNDRRARAGRQCAPTAPLRSVE